MSEWLHRTNKGKVIYDRKPHPFNSWDVVRVHRGWIDQASNDEIWDNAIAMLMTSIDVVERAHGVRGAYIGLTGVLTTILRYFQNEYQGALDQILQRIAEIMIEWLKWYNTLSHLKPRTPGVQISIPT